MKGCCECGNTQLSYYGTFEWVADKDPVLTIRTTTCLKCGKSWLHLPKETEQ